jgi:hypothetical protein
MDFLARFELSIIPAKQQILHAASGRTFTKASTTSFISPWSPETAAAIAALPTQVQHLLEEFPSLLRPSTAPPKPLHSIVHHIDTGSVAPVFARPRWPEKHCIAEEEFLTLEKAGIICRSNSPWSSPLNLVPKKDGSWGPCGDYRRLNAVTTPDRYPLANMQSLNDRMAGCTVFSKIDSVKAYHQIPIAEEDIPKTAIATPFGGGGGGGGLLFMGLGCGKAAQAHKPVK